MTGEGKKTLKFTRRVQFKLVAAFFALIAALLVLLNTYPVAASRDIVFSEKESSLIEQAAVISSSLSGLDTLSGDGAAQVVELLAVSGLERIIVTDAASRVLYDTASPSAEGDVALLSEIVRALSGEQVFWSRFAGGAFVSHAAIPIYRDGAVLGAVYLCERDTEQAEILLAFRDRLATVSIVALMAALGLTIVFTRRLTGRITRLSQAVRTVREGDYAHRVTVEGNDELSELYADFNSMTETLQKTEEQRRRFVSDASHELKTPLAAIRLLADSITGTDNIDPDTVREFVSDIATETERLQRTTEKLLDLSRRDDGARVKSVPVDVGGCAEDTLRRLAPLADKSSITLHCEAEPGCTILAPEDDVYQIVFNLAENAVKYNLSRRARGRVRPPRARLCAAQRRGHGHRHTRGGPSKHIFALLPRRQGPLARARRLRPRPEHSPRRRGRDGREDRCTRAGVRRHALYGHVPGLQRKGGGAVKKLAAIAAALTLLLGLTACSTVRQVGRGLARGFAVLSRERLRRAERTRERQRLAQRNRGRC